MSYTIIAARYSGDEDPSRERDICVTVEDDDDGHWSDCWYIAGIGAPPEAIALADEDEIAMEAAAQLRRLRYQAAHP